jgi:hypothetical protein
MHPEGSSRKDEGDKNNEWDKVHSGGDFQMQQIDDVSFVYVRMNVFEMSSMFIVWVLQMQVNVMASLAEAQAA